MDGDFLCSSELMAAFLMLGVLILLGISSNMWSTVIYADVSPGIYSIEVVNEFPHDPDAFTQGLLDAGNDSLFESTGLYGKSSVRKVAIRIEICREDILGFGDGGIFGRDDRGWEKVGWSCDGDGSGCG
ncbi:hypothetical protein TB1_013725 [Malus domestica]